MFYGKATISDGGTAYLYRLLTFSYDNKNNNNINDAYVIDQFHYFYVGWSYH